MTSLAKIVPASSSRSRRIIDWLKDNIAEPAVSGLLSASNAIERTDPRVLQNAMRAAGTTVGAIRGARRGHVEGAYEHLTDEAARKKRVRRDQLLGAVAGGALGYMQGNALGRPSTRLDLMRHAMNSGNPKYLLKNLADDKSHFAAGLLRIVAHKALNDKTRTTEIGRQRRLADDADSPTIMHNRYTREERAALRKDVAHRTKEDMQLLHRSKGYIREFNPEDIRQRANSGVLEDLAHIVKTTISPSLMDYAPLARIELRKLQGDAASPAGRAKKFLRKLEALKGLSQYITNDDRARISAVSTQADLTDAVKMLRRRLVTAVHPDRPGGSAQLMQGINAVVEQTVKTASATSSKRNLQKLRGLIAAYNAQRPAE